MPPRKNQGPNAELLRLLQELRDEHDKDENLYMVYNRAWKSLKSETRVFLTPEDLRSVKGIGPKTIKKLRERHGEADRPNGEQVASPPKRGRPPKRSATDAGVGVGPSPAAKRRVVNTAELPIPMLETPLPPNATGQFQFWYLDGVGNRVRDRVNAETNFFFDGVNELLLMKIAYPRSQDTHPLTTQLVRREPHADGFVAEMPEDLADDFAQCPGFAEAATPQRKSSSLTALLAEEENQRKKSRNTLDPSRQLPEYLRTGPNASASGSRNSLSESTSSQSDIRAAAAARSYGSSQSADPTPPTPRPLIRAFTTTATSSSSAARPQTLARTGSLPTQPPPTNRARLSHAIPAPAPIEHPSLYMPQTTFPDFAPHVLKAGRYAVQLVIDNRERSGKYSQDIFLKLLSNGLSVDQQALTLGDVTWVAICKETSQKYSLDVVLERKRLDDLVGSIKDGRFHEQKFRLHQSGISRVLYLVEEYETQKQRDAWGPQISTALSSTQVVDGFLVKETKNIQDTIAYLTGLTEELCRIHQTKDLYVIPTHLIKRHSYLDLQAHLRRTHQSRCYITSFADYQTLNSKSGFTTVRDTWARMLLCVRGMSAEKVGAVVERWATPRALWEAFQEAQAEEAYELAREAREEAAAAPEGPAKGKGRKKKSVVPEARMMLKGVGGSEGGMRAIGSALSSKLYELFMAESFEDGD